MSHCRQLYVAIASTQSLSFCCRRASTDCKWQCGPVRVSESAACLTASERHRALWTLAAAAVLWTWRPEIPAGLFGLGFLASVASLVPRNGDKSADYTVL